MVLLLHKDLANLFRHREFTKRFALPDAIAVFTNGVVFIFEIEPQHLFRIFRRAYRLGRNRWHFAEVINLPRDDQGMNELLLGSDFELRRLPCTIRRWGLCHKQPTQSSLETPDQPLPSTP